jgi:dTDP-4-amino-4,6-dideoxygalactose transaminase
MGIAIFDDPCEERATCAECLYSLWIYLCAVEVYLVHKKDLVDEIPVMATQRLPYPVPLRPVPRPVAPASSAPALMQVLRPQLPSTADLLPYLAEIDQRRWYSNSGPLVVKLEEQLSRHLGFSSPSVITTANATLGLTVALMARRVPAGSICLVPSWTFTATPHAARAAGLIPWFIDVDRRTWALNPDHVTETLKRMPRPVSALIVVSPFGAPIDVKACELFEDRTGVLVIVDAAAAFDSTNPSRLPCVVSLHATKILGAGEGGFIASTDSQFLERVRACCNFGFQGSRNAMLPALNAKMSEYHAAVALASLASWSETRERHVRIMDWYRRAAARLDRVSLQPKYGHGWVSGTTSVLLPPRTRDRVCKNLLQSGIETRLWWGTGCHTQPAFMDCPRGALPVTEELGGRVLGLPHFPDMRKQDVNTVVNALSEALSSRTTVRRLIA